MAINIFDFIIRQYSFFIMFSAFTLNPTVTEPWQQPHGIHGFNMSTVKWDLCFNFSPWLPVLHSLFHRHAHFKTSKTFYFTCVSASQLINLLSIY